VSLTILEPGFHTLLVDRGRPGSRHLGVPLGGAADRAALALANGLVGNPPDALALEITLLGPTLRAEERTACALFGAPFTLALANKGRLLSGAVFTLEAGDAVKIAGTPSGARAYFAVVGGFDGSTILQSCSALEPVGAGQVLASRESKMAPRALPFDAMPLATEGEAILLRALPGPQFKNFLKPEAFFGSDYAVTPASNRMGLRLAGPALERRAGELPSEAVAPGAVQVTNDGLPVVLGIDGQTIGGYPKIAHVIRADLGTLAQLRPGTRVRFAKVSAADAEAAAAERTAFLNEWLTRLAVTAKSLQLSHPSLGK
jgi:antagonist of KipI